MIFHRLTFIPLPPQSESVKQKRAALRVQKHYFHHQRSFFKYSIIKEKICNVKINIFDSKKKSTKMTGFESCVPVIVFIFQVNRY